MNTQPVCSSPGSVLITEAGASTACWGLDTALLPRHRARGREPSRGPGAGSSTVGGSFPLPFLSSQWDLSSPRSSLPPSLVFPFLSNSSCTGRGGRPVREAQRRSLQSRSGPGLPWTPAAMPTPVLLAPRRLPLAPALSLNLRLLWRRAPHILVPGRCPELWVHRR